ncbi:MAG: nicotinate-nucleotide diphosphorylase (carboxylating), partial [Candidatus Omnitrophica bacterium]|nr:nicotinate-nucleotide diphosphorylase (carboxylating) [Candidatus Omnitrophota bacterium]
VTQIQGYNVKLLDTRKTIPGLRALEKYAVKIGGGFNHRFCLDDMVLIKENHLKLIDLIKTKEVIKRLKKRLPRGMKIEIEVKSLEELRQVIEIEPDIIMLDNMTPRQVKMAVKLRNYLSKIYHPAKLEASGNINMRNIRFYAQSGVDFISLGTLTKDIKSLDVSLEIVDN